MSIEVREIEHAGRDIILVGTTIVAHEDLAAISQLVSERGPQTLVLDYDETRWEWLRRLRGGEELNLVDVIRQGEIGQLNSRLAMGVVSKWTAPRCEVADDEEFLVAMAAAPKDTQVVFARRSVEVEGVRAWRLAKPTQRLGLAWRLVVGSCRSARLDRDDLVEARAAFDPAEARNEITRRAGVAAPVILEESEALIAAAVGDTCGDTMLLTRAAHLDEVERHLRASTPVAGFDHVPQKSLFSRVVPWAFSAAIVAAFILGFVFADTEKMTQAAMAWFICNMIASAIGAAAALAHPVAIIATSLSSPFVSLNPAVGAGTVGALVQAFVAPPTVRDMDRVGDDITALSGWWRNKLSRIILVFVLANVASTIGSFVALAWVGAS